MKHRKFHSFIFTCEMTYLRHRKLHEIRQQLDHYLSELDSDDEAELSAAAMAYLVQRLATAEIALDSEP